MPISRLFATCLVVCLWLGGLGSATLNAGDTSCGKPCARPACGRCCCVKRCCRRLCPAPPRGQVAFAIPGVVSEGQAVRVSESAVRRALQDAAKDETQEESGARPTGDIDERLSCLERDMKQLTQVVSRLTTVVEKLEEECRTEK